MLASNPHINSFKITINFHDPSMDFLPSSTQTFEHNEALMFPEFIPPNHFHGWWVHLQGNSRATWTEYSPTMVPRILLDIPVNSPFEDTHWSGWVKQCHVAQHHSNPDDRQLNSSRHIAIISRFRTIQSILQALNSVGRASETVCSNARSHRIPMTDAH